MQIDLQPGLVGQAFLMVKEENSARQIGSGSMALLGTPEMICLMEQACTAALAGCLSSGRTTVGIKVDIKHIAPTPIGMQVTARADLIAVEGQRLTFKVEAFDAVERIGSGTHQRMIVNASKFFSSAESKMTRG